MRPETWLLAPLTLISFAPFALLAGGGDAFNGSDGLQVADHLQYMAFIRDAGENVLFSNRFDVVDDPHLFLHPTFVLSGLAWQLGVSIQLAFLAWKPIALLLLFFGFAAYVRRLLEPDRSATLVALALALFFFTPATALTDWLNASAVLQFGTGIVGLETYAAGYTLGASGGVLSVAMMPFFLLGVERVLEPSRRAPGRSARWYAVWAGIAGMLCSWLHPWQGMTLLLIVGVLALWERLDRRLLALVPSVTLTVLPLGYMWLLSKTDSSWATVSGPNDFAHVADWLFLGLAPAALALPGFRGRNLDVQERLLRIWPVAALVVYFALDRSWFYHAFVGISLPLAILAVKGLRPLRLPRIATVGAVLILTVPGVVWMFTALWERRDEHFFTSGERAALQYLDDADTPGAVLAPREPLGQAVPAFTGRSTWVGHYTWTPDNEGRSAAATALFDGELKPAEAQQLVRDSQAAFLASDCQNRMNLEELLGPMLAEVRRFGCATVYRLQPST